jgi:hypothetical protein
MAQLRLKDGQARALSMLRLSETVTIPDGEYGEKTVQQVRLLTPGGYQLHQKGDDGEFRITDEGTTSLRRDPIQLLHIPTALVILESRPPLEDIAELNLKQYQVQSDVDNQLHISAVPMLAFFGFPSAAEEVSAGPGEAIAFPSRRPC